MLAASAYAPAPTMAAVDGPWSRSFEGLCQSAIVARNNLVYVGTDDGVLRVVSASDGRTAWTYRSGVRGVAAPSVERGRVWLGVVGGTLHALDAFTGRRLWVHGPSAPAPAPATSSLYPGPASLRGRLFQVEGRRLVAIDKTSGRGVDSLILPDGELTQPVATDRAVVLGVDRTLYAVASQLNKTLWRRDLKEEGPTTPVYAAGSIFAGTRKGSVYAIDAVTGRLRWGHGGLPAAVSGVASDGVLVFVVTTTGNVYTLDAGSGSLKWRFDTGGALVTPPIASGMSVLFGSNDGRLYSVVADDGDFEWSYDTMGAYPVSLAAQDDVVFLVSNIPAGDRGSIRLAAYDIAGLLRGLRAFSTGRVAGRRAEQDNVSIVLVDSVVEAARRVGSEGGVFAALWWPYRFLSVAGNPNTVVRGSSKGPKSRGAEPLAISAAVLGLTVGPASLAGFLLVFLLSALGFVAAPRLVPILGRAGEAGSGSPAGKGIWRDSARLAVRSGRAAGLALGAEAVAVPAFVLMRLIAGPADELWPFIVWAGLSSLVLLLVSASCRVLMLRWAWAKRERDERATAARSATGRAIFRVASLYVLSSLVLAAAFFLVDLSGTLNQLWLLPVAALCLVVSSPALVADCFVAVDDQSLPRSLLSAVLTMRELPGEFSSYVGAAGGAVLAPTIVGTVLGPGAGFAVALLACPAAAAFLSAMCAELCYRSQPRWVNEPGSFTSTK